MTSLEPSATPGDSRDELSVDRGVVEHSAALEVLRDLRNFQRHQEGSLDARLKELSRIEISAIDRVAAAEDGEISTLTCAAVLLQVDHWRRLCDRRGLSDFSQHCRPVEHQAIEDAALDWEKTLGQRAESIGLDELFEKLIRAVQLQIEAERRFGEASAAEQRLHGTELTLRELVEKRIEESKPDAKQIDDWSRLISDQCDTVLTSIEDVEPDQAVRQIDTAAESARWFITNVNRKRGRATSRVKRKLSRLAVEKQERQLQSTLEKKLGRRGLGFMERTVLVLICVVLALMTIEWTVDLSAPVLRWFAIIDGIACVIFLLEFAVKLHLVEGKWSWFRRHLFVDLIPSIPVGLLSAGLAESGDLIRAGRVTRFIRLPRLVRYLRLLRPVIRIVRALGLLARGIDRIVRQFGRILNCNLNFYPTSDELKKYLKASHPQSGEAQRIWRRIRDQWTRLLLEADDKDQLRVSERRLAVLNDVVSNKQVRFEEGISAAGGAREIPAELLLDQMQSADEDSIEAGLGEALVAQLARVVRAMAGIPMRWLPIIRQCVPKKSQTMNDAEVVAVASRKTAGYMRRFYDLWFWVADLYGTVTPSQFVDRVGGMLVKSSFRPAYRLALFGGILLLIDLVLNVVSSEALTRVRGFLTNYVGNAVMLLGSVCFLILGLGWWLQRLAQEATEFYRRAVNAQFLALTESIRTSRMRRDAAVLFDRVLKPDWPEEDHSDRESCIEELVERFRESLVRTRAVDDGPFHFPMLDRLVLLYRDWLDGGLFTSSDTRATSQLLGNTAIRQLMLSSGRVSRKQLKQLQLLDLEQQKSLMKGPYLWFNFISQSVAHSVACLLVDYNRRAIPVSEIDHSPEATRRAYNQWLQLSEGEAADPGTASGVDESHYVTTAFTAMHFLEADPDRDRDIEERFGEAVLERLKRDRSLLIRRVFGTLPMHELPRSQRVINVYTIYEGWIAKGRIFLIPLFLFVAVLRTFFRGVGWLYRAVQEIRHPEQRSGRVDAAQSDFRVAVRKINRIRSPLAEASMRLRAKFDPGWLGTPLPGETGTRLGNADVWTDLPFLAGNAQLERDIEDERRRSEANMRRLERLLSRGLLEKIATTRGLPPDAFSSREHHRAAAVAIHADVDGIRSHLLARELLVEVFQTTDLQPRWHDRLSLRFKLRSMLRRYWRPDNEFDGLERRRAWRAVLKNDRGVADALKAWAEHEDKVEAEGERRLGEVLIHPARISEQLVTMRMVQSLALLDVLHYRQQVYELGQYEVDSVTAHTLLRWGTVAVD